MSLLDSHQTSQIVYGAKIALAANFKLQIFPVTQRADMLIIHRSCQNLRWLCKVDVCRRKGNIGALSW